MKLKKKYTKVQKKALSRRKAVIKSKRPYRKKVLLHPASIFTLLCVGVLLIGSTLHVIADNFSLTGQKLAPIPTQPIVFAAVIPVSSDGTTGNTMQNIDSVLRVKQPTILLEGSCPRDTYIKFYRNDIFAGTTMCIGDPTFNIEIGLDQGLNVIVGHVFSITDGEGPSSINLSVMYNSGKKSVSTPTVSQSTTPNSHPSKTTASLPFYIMSDFSFHGVFINHSAQWDIVLNNGTPKYVMQVDFGDSKVSNISVDHAGKYTLTHTYTSAGGYNGNYPIKIKATDSKGDSTFLQLLAVVNNPVTTKACTNVTNNSNCYSGFIYASNKTSRNWLLVAWPTYVIILLMTSSFWLGEREEVYRLYRHKRSKRR